MQGSGRVEDVMDLGIVGVTVTRERAAGDLQEERDVSRRRGNGGGGASSRPQGGTQGRGRREQGGRGSRSRTLRNDIAESLHRENLHYIRQQEEAGRRRRMIIEEQVANARNEARQADEDVAQSRETNLSQRNHPPRIRFGRRDLDHQIEEELGMLYAQSLRDALLVEGDDRGSPMPRVRLNTAETALVRSSIDEFVEEMQLAMALSASTVSGANDGGPGLSYEELSNLEDVKCTATEAEIRALGIHSIGNNDKNLGTRCSVCMDDFKVGDDAVILKCSHAFHYKCITNWFLNYAKTCPTCRQDAF